MDYLEKAVDEHLASRLDDEGLSLRYVDCPHWDGRAPSTLTCKGYVDGVVAQVTVALSRGAHGGTEFDAWLEEGVVSTGRLVDRLERQGYTRVRCGSVPAYPARVGMRIVCRVNERGRSAYLVATVIDRHGAVRIQDY